jgi:hypothetical protein
MPPLDPALERQLAVDLFNATWQLLDTPDRSSDDDLRMIHMAHASRHLWAQVGEPVNLARGEWQVSRVYAVLGRVERDRRLAQARTAAEAVADPEDREHLDADLDTV